MSENSTPMKATKPSEYRKKVFGEEVVEAPSGNKFKIKKLSPIDFLENGLKEVANPYLELLEENKKDPDGKDDKGKTDNPINKEETVEFFTKVLEVVISKGILSPKIALEYDVDKKDDFLFWGEIADEDQIFLVSVIAGMKLKK